ncbi:GntR family transcriptional regulator [Lentzea jiangxiensis]|uniref:GntR family transcriptional regulator, transcriptional repressor for pyruvate dehydrogenase complex/GntR family transcriptional regulator n=1 Tax=Lentzea jiangxiensis TaxID=641025 RepID=A0A1H0DIX6_9PSEU|nr:winged helix-turn-helix domain-containing protein [Lentzea jiangxiensis]SDN70105.1 GntR family transcriptional regulator, transcriptional repressor for pyruvate dehydrogenase complex/GntR family transcriptional regulator [Lentzea jiangxiensis]
MSQSPARSYPYQQVAAKIIEKIRAGKLPPDQKLPTIREMADEYGITTATVQRVIRALTDGGYAETVPGVGVFVSKVLPDAEPTPPATVEQLAAELFTLRRSVEELAERLERVESRTFDGT